MHRLHFLAAAGMELSDNASLEAAGVKDGGEVVVVRKVLVAEGAHGQSVSEAEQTRDTKRLTRVRQAGRWRRAATATAPLTRKTFKAATNLFAVACLLVWQ